MDFIFADDSRQNKPSRENIKGPLLAIGGLHVSGDQVGPLERALRKHCESIDFPHDEQFKWSPGSDEVFQREKLNDNKHITFYTNLLDLAAQHNATVTVVVVDASKAMARRKSKSHENDVIALFFERCDWALCGSNRVGVPIIAKPSGGPKDEKKFIAECLELIHEGTKYVNFRSLAIGILTAPSKQIRLLQLADIVTSCTVARISGESQFSPQVFKSILPLFRNDSGRIGGVGLKIHPDFSYVNLYHWLLGDTYWRKGNSGIPLPIVGYPYYTSAGEIAYELQ